MNESSRKKLIEIAESIEEFQSLELEERLWLLPLMSRGIRTTLEILDLISGEKMTYEEIALEMDMNPQTVQQKLNALKLGGYPIDLDDCAAIAHTGRPRKLVRVNNDL